MAASLKEASANLEVLEASDEGKKKSKFKAFKNFFGKKKRKEPEAIQRRSSSSLKPSSSNSSINNSSLNLVQEGQQPTFRKSLRVRRSMSKSLSHESIFMLESEPESPQRKIYPSPELQSGRSLERSVSRTLSITSSVHRSVSGTLLGVMPHYVHRSGIWIGGSKITEIPPLRARQPNINPSLTRSDTISKDFEEISADDESPKTPRKKAFPPMLTMKKSSFEPSSIPMRAQSLTTFATLTSPSSPQLSVSFSTPATTQGCLDSSAARHKMALNPRKQKKYLQATMKPKQEEPSLPLVSEEKTKPKAVIQKKLKDSAGPSSQEQSIKTEIYMTTDQAANADAAESQGCSWPAAYGKRHGKKESSVSEKNECGSIGWSFIQPSRGLDLGNRAGYPSADKIDRDSPFCHFSLETQVMKQPRAPQVENTTPQELLSDENDTRRRMAGLDVKTRKASISYIRPNDMKESMDSGPSQYLEDGVSGTKKSEAITSLSSMVENPSTSQEDTMFSVAGEAQVHMDPSHIQSEEEEASSFDSKSDQFEMKSAQDISTICKETPSGNVIQAFPASVLDMASALTEGGISVERMPPRSLSQSLGKPEAEGVSLDSDSISELESGSEELDHEYSFQSVMKSKGDQEAFPDSKSFVGNLCSSHEQLAARCASQALEEPEDKVPTESNSNSAKHSNPNDWSSSEEDMPPRHPSPVLGAPTAQQEISVSKNTLEEELVVSMEQTPPRHLPQPSVKPSVEQQLSSGSASAFSEWVSTPPMNFFHPWLSPKSEEQASEGQASIAPEWGIFMEPLPPRMHSRRLMKHKIEQPISSGPEIEGITSTELKPSRNNSQTPVKPIAEQEISAGPESTAVKGSISMEPPSPNVLAQPMMNPKVEQNMFLGSEGADKVILVEPTLPECSTNPQDEHVFSENTASNKDMFVEPLPPNYPGQPLVKLTFQPQTIPSDPGSASTEWSDPVELMPPRHTMDSWVSTSFEQQPSASPESTAVEWGNPTEPLPPKMPSQSLRRPVAEQEVFSGSMSAPEEWSGLVQLKPPQYTLQPWVSPKFEQQTYAGPESTMTERSISMEPLPPRKPSQHWMKSVVKQPISAGPKSVAIERDISTELLPPRHWSIVRHKIQKMMPTSENAAVGCISERPLPIEYPIHFSKPNIHEISLHPENTAVEGGMSKKSLHLKCPSQSFVKFMAQHVFSESPNMEEQVYVDPLSSNQPSKYLLKPAVEHQVFSGCESADIEGGISSKLLPTKHPLQSSGRPEDPQGVFSYSENAPVKCSYPQEQLLPGYLSQAWRKFKYEQEVTSVSESSLKEWKSSEEQLPSKCPIQAEDGAEFQPQISSTGSVSVPVERSSAENRLPPRHPFQAFADPQYKQQVYSSSMSAAAKGTIFESNPSSWTLPRGPASPSKTRGHSQDSEDLFKDISTPATKPVRFTLAPAWPPSTSGDTYSKEDVLESSDQNNDYSNLSTSEADVENVFGVRLKRIPSSQKYKSKEQNNSTKLPSLSLGPVSSYTGREPQIRSASQGLLGIAKNLTTTSDVAEKQKSKPKSDSMPKKKPDYKIPGKAPGKHSGYATSEPSWITMVKQKQKNSTTQVPTKELKTNNRAGAKAGTKVPRYEGADLAKQSQQREISISNVNRQQKTAQIKLLDYTKAVGYENEKIIQVPAMRKETRQSSAHPAMFQEPAEPIWFSMAKKKAKAWSQITETMQF
ncbi:acrosomal protein KIAA1210 homolog [Eptesicus fuscus]|uniref:acrosomal protein KIAA1210 homolog n=1 Tax=Eptesicus fuscus TaxID=29078 RepID=UPI0024047EC6|nr:acrosomal protein KIAA1210 homolog [Eptesicus fuscus]